MDTDHSASAGFAPWLGVFETIRVVNGRPLFLPEHEQSLRDAAAALGFRIALNLAARVSILQNQTGRWRWIVNRDGAFDFFQPENKSLPESFFLVLAPQRLGSQNWDARYKTLSYLTHDQARRFARENGADEAILLNEHGRLATAAMANLFWIKKSRIYTPALDEGCRNGVIRQWILKNSKVQEGAFALDELDKADEIFITNSMIGLMPVSRCQERAVPIGKKTAELQKRYRDDCGKTKTKTGSGCPPAP
jgi:branched-subunit amino acid aminotransferase/4-amino-4-deoxychorismate lyase